MTNTQQPRAFALSAQLALEMGAKLLPLAATICIALSVLFDMGYLSALDLRLSEVPTSLSDHTRSAMLWLPLVALCLPLGVVFGLFMGEIQLKANLAAKDRGEDPLQRFAKEAKRFRLHSAIGAIVLFVLWLALGDRWRPLLWAVVAIALAHVVRLVTPTTSYGVSLGIGSLVRIRIALFSSLAVAVILYSAGYEEGRAAAAPNQPLGTLVVRGATGSEQIAANIVRPFEKFVIVLDARKKIVLLKPEDIVRVEKVGDVSTNTGLLCEYWQFACPHVSSQTP